MPTASVKYTPARAHLHPDTQWSRRPAGHKKVLIAVDLRMLSDIDHIAYEERRTRSDLIREAMRRYIANFERDRGALIPQAPLEPEEQSQPS